MTTVSSVALHKDKQVGLPSCLAGDWPSRADLVDDDDDDEGLSSLRYFAGEDASADAGEGGAAAAELDAGGGVARQGSDGSAAGSGGSGGGEPNSDAKAGPASRVAGAACVLGREGTTARRAKVSDVMDQRCGSLTLRNTVAVDSSLRGCVRPVHSVGRLALRWGDAWRGGLGGFASGGPVGIRLWRRCVQSLRAADWLGDRLESARGLLHEDGS